MTKSTVVRKRSASAYCGAVLAMAAAAAAMTASAQDEAPAVDGAETGFDFTFSGFTRLDTAIRASGKENPYNQRGNLFNGKTVDRCAGVPGAYDLPTCVPNTKTRTGQGANNEFNLQQFRTHLDFGFSFNQHLSARVLARGVYELGEYDNFDPDNVASDADGYLYGKPNYFEDDSFKHGGSQNRLELAGRHYMADLPTAIVDYQNGPALIRVGNQQIAWGQALFFRVLDVPNGLDLRRHLFIDYAPEEYADERISSPAIRASYQFESEWEVDSFAQMFQPTVYTNPNTPYNVIASQFTVHDSYGDSRNKVNYGIRARGHLGDFGLQFIFADRVNPDGVFRWTESGVNRDIAGLPGTGLILAQTPFEVDPSGVASAQEWFTYAGMARLNGRTALNSSITEFPAAALLGAMPVTTDAGAGRELDLFFTLSDGMRGHLQRDYFREKNYGAGASYVIEAAPGSLLDQLIVNLEATYTPNRHFTNPSLSRNYLVEDEIIAALVTEKYQRFSQSFPATYLVAQWMHRTKSDLFGRSLQGMGGDTNTVERGVNGGWDAVVLAAQQPFPNLVYRIDAAVLYDTRGGILAQLGLRWKPSGPISAEIFYTYLNGNLNGSGTSANENIISTIDYADELGIRLGYQF